MAGKKSSIDKKALWDLLSKRMSLASIAEGVGRKSVTKAVIQKNLFDYALNEDKTMKNVKARLSRVGLPKVKKGKKSKPKVKKEYGKINASGSISIPASIIKAKGIELTEEAIKYVRYDVRVTKKTGKISLTPEIDMVKVENNYGGSVDADEIKELILKKISAL